MPYHTNASPIFGKDIVIQAKPEQNQRNIAVCSAFNGWLYAIYTYNNGPQPYCTTLRSIDGGITWNVLLDATIFSPRQIITRANIMACGNNLADLKVFIGFAYMDTVDYLQRIGAIWVARYKGEPFAGEAVILEDNTGWYKDLAFASDCNYPSASSNPFNIAFLYSKASIKDSLIFCSSGNGGISIDNRKVLTYSNQKFGKVSLSYGKSASQSSGRYFAAWENKAVANAATGHIYTAHSEPDLNGPFTMPFCIDSLDPGLFNKSRNPVLVCQASDYDNDSSNLTELLLFEKYIQETNSYDIRGFYNLQATAMNHFRDLSLSVSTNIKSSPDVVFNPFDSSFMVTYFDSTEKKLPFIVNNFNLKNPNQWTVVSSSYNDSTNLRSPFPKVIYNQDQHNGADVWVGERTGGNGIAMFDAPYSIWTNVPGNNKPERFSSFGAFPNPCSNEFTLWFILHIPGKVNIALYDISGNRLLNKTNQYSPAGKQYVKVDISSFPSGLYYYSFTSESASGSGKILVIK